MTATQERPARRDRQGPPPQGGPAPHHRPHPLDRQHHPAGDAAPGDGAQPVRPRDHHLGRRRGGQGLAQRRRRAVGQGLRRRARRLHQRLADHAGPEDADPLADARPTGSPSPARSSPSWSPAARPRRATPPSWSTSSTTSCRPCIGIKNALEDEVLAHPDLGTNKSALLGLRLGRGRHRLRRRGGHREGAHRRHRHRARVPPAAADPGLHGAPQRRGRTPPASRSPCGRRPRSRTSSGSPWRPPPACPRAKIRVIAPDVGGGFGGKLADHPRGVDRLGRGPPAVQAGQVHRDPQREPDGGAPRPRPGADAHPGRRQGRQGHRVQGAPRRRPRRLHRARRRRRPGAGRLHVQRDLQVPRLPVRVPDGAHQHDLDRRLPRRRPAGGDVRHRADHGRAGRRGRRGPARDPRAQLDHARGVPVHHRGRPGVRLRQLRGRDRARPRSPSATTRCAPSRRSAATAATAVQLGIGVSTFTEMCGLAPSRVLGSLDYGAGGWEHASVRMLATGKVEVVTGTSAHGQGHETAFSQIVADRLGVAVRGRRGAARRHPGRAQGPRHLRLPLAGGRRRGAGPRGRQGDREGQGTSRPTCSRPARTTSSTPTAGSPSAAPTRASASRSSPRRPSPAHNYPDGHGAAASTPRRPTTR